VVDKVALGQDFPRVLGVSPVAIIRAMLSIHLQLHVGLTGRRNGRKPGNLPESNGLSEIGEHLKEKVRIVGAVGLPQFVMRDPVSLLS
jgi:hypothetical protein